MAQNLSTGVDAGGAPQTTTQSPQTATAANGFGGQSSSGIQPGTSTNLLNSGKAGVALKNQSVTNVSLGSASTTTAQTAAPSTVTPKHLHPTLFVFSFILLVLAVYLFYSASRSAKNTTD